MVGRQAPLGQASTSRFSTGPVAALASSMSTTAGRLGTGVLIAGDSTGIGAWAVWTTASMPPDILSRAGPPTVVTSRSPAALPGGFSRLSRLPQPDFFNPLPGDY